MARGTETPRLNHQPISPNPTANPPGAFSRAHTDFMEVRVHTAKCDSCEKHNKLTLYRCMECGQHVCSSCWKKSGDRTHVFGGGSRNAPKLATNNVIENGSGGSKKGRENAGTTRTRRRVHVISDDDDDDNSSVLRPSPITRNPEPLDASKQQSKRTNFVMNGNQHQDHPYDSPDLWPMVPRTGLPVSRPAVPTDNTTPTESANPATQRNPHIQGEADDPGRQQIAQLRRQCIYTPVSDQEAYLPVFRPSQRSVSTQQATVCAHLLEGDIIYRPRLGSDRDGQATSARNELGFVNPQLLSLQAPRFAQPSVTFQQDPQLLNVQAPRLAQPSVTFQQVPRQILPAIYRTQPGADVDSQAARFQVAFVPHQQNGGNRQAPRPAQAPVSHQHAVHVATRPSQPSVSITQHQDQTAANTDQVAARDQSRAIYSRQVKQHAEAYANAKAIDAHNRQALNPQQNAQLAANREQLASRNQQAFIANQASSSSARYEQTLAARDAQQAYLSRQRQNRPASGSGQTWVSQQRVTDNVPPSQAFLSQIRASASLASGYSPEVIEAADALLLYAGAEQNRRDLSRSEQNGNRDSYLLSPATQPENQSFARSGSRSSSATLVSPSAVAGAQSIVSPRGLAPTPSPRDTGADSAKARLEKHWRRLPGLQSPLGTRSMMSDTPAIQPNPPASNRHATLQPGSGPTFTDSSAAQPDGSSFRSVQSHPDSRVPMSEHAAAYVNQWDAGRAALSTNTNDTAVNFPAPMSESPRSAVPAIGVQDSTAGGEERVEVAEASAKAPSTPVSVPGGSNGVDFVMDSPEAEIAEDGKLRSSEVRPTDDKSGTIVTDTKVENHTSSELKDEVEIKQEPEASGDWKWNIEEEHARQIHNDDNDDDVEIVFWKKTNDTTTADNQRGANTKTKEAKLDRVIKRGVAYVKKPEPKARNRKILPKNVG